MEAPPRMVILPGPGMGHLIAFLEFAKHLINHHDVSVTVIVPATGKSPKAQTAVLESLSKTINYVSLPPVSFEDLLKDSAIEVTIFLAVTRSLSSFRDTVKLLITKTNLVALIADPLGTDAFLVTEEFNISPYLFFSSNAKNFSFSYILPKSDEIFSCEFRDLFDLVKIPGGCVPVHGRHFMDPLQDWADDVYKLILHHYKAIQFS